MYGKCGNLMNILFIGPYRQNDEWGNSSIDSIKSLLLMNGHTITCSPMYMVNNVNNNISQEIIESEKRKCEKYDAVILHALPNYFEKLNTHTIGMYASETKHLENSVFIDNINLLDELWTISELQKQELKAAGVTIPITVIPKPVDIEQLEQHENANILDIPEIKNKFVFYVSEQYEERKNINATIIAYNREFSNNHDVSLIIHSYANRNNPKETLQVIKKDILETKKKLRLYNNANLYPGEILITNKLSNEQLASLHNTGDCLLVTSRGESYSKIAMEALFFGNQVICTEGTHYQYILQEHCSCVRSTETPIMANNPPAQHIHTGWETWNEINILDLQRVMREKYNRGKSQNTNENQEKDWIKDNFSYEETSRKMEKALCQ